MTDRHAVVPSVHLVLIRDGKILLGRRQNSGYEDGNYSLPAGHLVHDETVREGMVREAREELAIMLETEDLRVVHVTYRRKTDHQRVDFFLTTDSWGGEIKNNEPERCDDLQWFELDALPENTIPYIRQAIDCIRRNQPFSEFGW